MNIIMFLWAVLSVVSICQICYGSWKRSFVWQEAMFKLQTVAIGLMFFPFYWDVALTVQLTCLFIGIGLFSLYAGVILWKTPTKKEWF